MKQERFANQCAPSRAADPATFALAAIVVGAVALLACLLPARQAVKVDPLAALRSE